MHKASSNFPLWLWYLQEFLRGLVLIYPTYLIMMEQAGIDPLGLSILLAIWSGSKLLFEVPSGVLGDLLPRRWLLIAAGFVHATAFITWWLAPSFWGFALGFTIWSFGGALYSGTAEAYLFEATKRAPNTSHLDFTKLYGRTQAAAGAGIALALGTGGFAASYSYEIPLFLSMLTPILASLAMVVMPDSIRDQTTEGSQRFVKTLVAGSSTLLRTTVLRQIALTSGTLFTLLWVFEEYIGVLFTEQGFSLTLVGLIYAGVWSMRTLGNLLAHRLSGIPIAHASLLFGSACLAAAVMSTAAATFMVLGLWLVYAVEGLCYVVLSSRLQGLVDDQHRATITSVMGMLSELFGLMYYIFIGIIAGFISWTGTLYVALALSVSLSIWWYWRLRVPHNARL